MISPRMLLALLSDVDALLSVLEGWRLAMSVSSEQQMPTVELEELSVEQSHALFDEYCREWLSISGKDFLVGYRAGEIVETPEVPAVTELVMMLPLVQS